jgi:hypothetical protein
MSPSARHDSQPPTLGRAVQTACFRGIRLGALVGGISAVTAYVGAFVFAGWSFWRAGYPLRLPPGLTVGKLVFYPIAGVLGLAGYCAVLGGIAMSLIAAFSHRRRRVPIRPPTSNPELRPEEDSNPYAPPRAPLEF